MTEGTYREVPKFSDTKMFAVSYLNPNWIQTKRPNLRLFCQNGAKGIANSEDPDQTATLFEDPDQTDPLFEDPDQTAPLGAAWSGSALFAQNNLYEN